MIVADTSLIASFFLETEITFLAQAVYEKNPIWIFPPIWQEEYANVLAKLARKNSDRTGKEILSHFAYALSELQTHERHVAIIDVLRLALEYKISVYDAHFVQLAVDNNIKLVTEDREVLKKCPGIAYSMREFLRSKE